MAEDEEILPKYSFKVIVLGDTGVGKSSLLRRFQLDEFDPTPSHTIGVGFSTHRVNVGPEEVQLNLWDTAGEERFKSLTSQYYRNADAAIIVFDLTSKKSFNNAMNYWIKAFQQVVGSDAYVVFVGNKSDLTEDREVDSETFQDLASLYCSLAWETSAKEASNVEEVFHKMARELIVQVDQLKSLQSGPESLFLHKYSEHSQEGFYGYCCWNS